jgi:hypothetical protein
MIVFILFILIAIMIVFFVLRKRKTKNTFIPDKMLLTLYAGNFQKQIFEKYPNFVDYPDLIKRIYIDMVTFFNDDKLLKRNYKYFKGCKSEKEIVLNYYYFEFLNLSKEAHSLKYEYQRQPEILLDWTKQELSEIGYAFRT